MFNLHNKNRTKQFFLLNALKRGRSLGKREPMLSDNQQINKYQKVKHYTVESFHTKGRTNFFSGQIFNFWGQKSVFIVLRDSKQFFG
jgi:hypothetical protein